MTVTKGFSERLPREPTEVIALGTTLSFFSMSVAVGLGALVAWPLPGWAAWPLCPLISTVAFVLLAGAEMAVAGYRHEAGGIGGDFDA
ncbi:MAG: hypothetical protein QOF43_1414 [Gaiellaceae bacterium]|nr:hypothetical protein [Gaiellaceae bacterium]